ncbi:disease resistance protein RUN1-like [Mercurialis annua]|uniref:disease resistance protein RUN1-like n=1 Tax=Mercurialis annua TaxID=3986 RepID=UPI0024AEE7B9|nr:disease resistance protein RUN1-like [Mercurialis annua]
MSKVRDIELSSSAFERMSKLKFIKFYGPCYEEGISNYQQNKIFDPCGNINISLSRELRFLPNDLRYLYWHKYPSKHLPMNFLPQNLVHLHLMYSQIQQLGDKNQCLVNLRFMDLSYSMDLLKIPDLSELPKLEILRLRGCASLVEIFSSNQLDSKLSHIDLGHCKRLDIIPSFLHLKNLNFLSLEGCSNINEFPKVPRNIKHLVLNRTAIELVPFSVGRHTLLTKLSLKKCTRIKLLPNCTAELKCLKDLNLNGCSQLESLPDNIGKLKCLKYLWLNKCSKLMNLPDGICNLKSLKELSVKRCQHLKELPENLGALESLKRLYASKSGIKRIPPSINGLTKLVEFECDGCEGLVLTPFTGLSSLVHLSLQDCGMIEFPSNISSLISLRALTLNGNNLEMLSTSFKKLSKLQYLDLRNCKRLKCLYDLPSALEYLLLNNCTLLELLPSSVTKGNMTSLWCLDATNCANLDQNECISIANSMLLRLEILLPRLKSFSNYISQIMVQHNVRVCTYDTGLHFSGGQVLPKLMHQNNNGSSLLLSLIPGSHDFMVLAVCAVVAFIDTPSEDCDSDHCSMRIKCECRFMADSGHTLCFEIVDPDYPFLKKSWDKVLGSEHTSLWCSSVLFTQSKYSFNNASFQFYPVFYHEGQSHVISTAVVIKCGVHILYDDNHIGPLTLEDNFAPLDVPMAWGSFCIKPSYSVRITEDDEEEGLSSSY